MRLTHKTKQLVWVSEYRSHCSIGFASVQEELMRFSFDEIVSTRKLRSQAERQYLDIKCGNLM